MNPIESTAGAVWKSHGTPLPPTLAEAVFNAVLGTRHNIARHAITLHESGKGRNALAELHQRINDALAAHDAPQAAWDGNRGTLGPCSAAIHFNPDPRELRPHSWAAWANSNNAYIGEGSCKTAAEARAMCEAVAHVYLAHHPEAQQQESAPNA